MNNKGLWKFEAILTTHNQWGMKVSQIIYYARDSKTGSGELGLAIPSVTFNSPCRKISYLWI